MHRYLPNMKPDSFFTLDGCNDGDALLGGASKAEGIVEVCFNGTYLPVSLDNGRFSVREATAICNQLNLGNGLSSIILLQSYHQHQAFD